MTPTDPKPAPATDEEIAEWNPALRNIEAAVYPWKVARLIARIEADRARIDELEAEVEEARATKDMHKERQEEAWAEVESLKAENERLRRTNCTCLTARQKGESK